MMKKSSRQHDTCISMIFDFLLGENNPVFKLHQLYHRFPSGFPIQSDEQVLFCSSALNRPIFVFPVQSDEQIQFLHRSIFGLHVPNDERIF